LDPYWFCDHGGGSFSGRFVTGTLVEVFVGVQHFVAEYHRRTMPAIGPDFVLKFTMPPENCPFCTLMFVGLYIRDGVLGRNDDAN